MTSPEIQAFFEQTLLGDYDDEKAWAAVSALRVGENREIFERAAEWCQSEDPLKKARAADILCQLRHADPPGAFLKPPEWLCRDESYALVTSLLETERDPVVLNSVIHALGHLGSREAVPSILRYQDHPDAKIRFAVAFALGCFPNDGESVAGLIKLTSGPDPDVRDWAVFGLGVLGDVDSPEIRDVLLRCLNDTDEDVREEAAVGLGKRRDRRAVPAVLHMLEDPSPGQRATEAAAGLLGLEKAPDGWSGADYTTALRTKFNL